MSALEIEARRLAKIDVRRVLRNKGYDLDTIDAHSITLAANELIEQFPKYTEQAKANLATAHANPTRLVRAK